jgi:hypothetical protein
VESRIVYGYQPAVYSLDNSPARQPAAPQSDVVAYTESPERVAEVRQITLLDGQPARILLLEMPLHSNYINQTFGSIDGYRRTFHESLRHQTTDTQAMLWATDTLVFNDADYADTLHLWASGSARFSEWLGYQIGEAANRGLFGDAVPEDLRFNPPLDVSVPPLAVNVSGADALPGIVLDPLQTPLDSPSSAQQIALLLEWAIAIDEEPLTEEGRQHLQEFLSVLNQAQRPDESSLANWRSDLGASHLRQAGITYVLVPSGWLEALSAEQQAALSDSAQYEIIDNWWHPVQDQAYTLYRVVD